MPDLSKPYFWAAVASTVALVWVQIVKPSAVIVIIVGGIALAAYSAAIWLWLGKFQYPEVATRQYHEIGLKIFGVGLLMVAVVLLFLLERQAFLPSTNEAKIPSHPQRSDNIGESQSNKTTEQLRLEERQRRRTRPYTIPKADQEELIRILKLAGPFQVDIEYDVNSDLAEFFAEELKTLLTLSRWKVDDPSPVAVVGPRPLRGVIITVNENEEVPLGASLLRDSFIKHDIDVELKPAPPRKVLQASFYIFIGPKS